MMLSDWGFLLLFSPPPQQKGDVYSAAYALLVHGENHTQVLYKIPTGMCEAIFE